MKRMESVIEVSNLSKYYKGGVVALNGLFMEVKSGLTGFLGPNGAGKSTTIKLANGEIKPSSGRIQVFGENPWNNPMLHYRIGYVSEHEKLYPWMTAEHFVTCLGAINMPRAQARKLAREKLQLCGLGDAMRRKMGGFSKGMKQMVKLAQALVHEPELIIADEPLSGLDPINRAKMMELFLDLEGEGRTILVSSHVLHELERISQRIVLIFRGRTIAEGNIREIRNLIDQHPHSIQIDTTDPDRLAKALIDADWIASHIHLDRRPHPSSCPQCGAGLLPTSKFCSDCGYSVEGIGITEGSSTLKVMTSTPDQFYSTITAIAAQEKIRITRIESLDDNLDAVFRFLTE
ncbi:MAG: ATP-binding cassette domain-containing protein [Candidatus Thorarchaeota archaeon]